MRRQGQRWRSSARKSTPDGERPGVLEQEAMLRIAVAEDVLNWAVSIPPCYASPGSFRENVLTPGTLARSGETGLLSTVSVMAAEATAIMASRFVFTWACREPDKRVGVPTQWPPLRISIIFHVHLHRGVFGPLRRHVRPTGSKHGLLSPDTRRDRHEPQGVKLFVCNGSASLNQPTTRSSRSRLGIAQCSCQGTAGTASMANASWLKRSSAPGTRSLTIATGG